MKKPVKVLFLLEDLCFGGTQKQNLELALRLDANQFAPSLLVFTGPTDLDGMASALPAFYLGSTRKVAPLFFLKLPKILAQLKPDILVPCTALPNIWGRIWGKFLKIPLVVGTCRGGGAQVRQHEQLLWRLADHIICNSYASMEALQKIGVPRKRMSYIANGLDTEYFKPAGYEFFSDAPVIVCVGRLAKDKNHTLLLAAFEKVCKKFPDVRLRLVGEGPEEKALKDFVSHSMHPGARARVEFTGATMDPLKDYQQASIFAISSLREGQPNVVLEAMSSGLPVCATAVGGIPDLVKHGETGLLSSSGDADAFAENLIELLQNRDRARNMGQAGRAFVKAEFSFHAMVAAHEKLFGEQLDKRLRCKN